MAKTRRLAPPSKIGWEIHFTPDGDGAVTIVLPITTDCTEAGAVPGTAGPSPAGWRAQWRGREDGTGAEPPRSSWDTPNHVGGIPNERDRHRPTGTWGSASVRDMDTGGHGDVIAGMPRVLGRGVPGCPSAPWKAPSGMPGQWCPASTIFAGWRQLVLPVHLLGLDALLGSVGPVAGDVKLQDDGVASGWMSRAARRCTTAAEESCTTRTMRNN